MPNGKFFIIFNPDYHAPPTVIFGTQKGAEEIAAKMADQFQPNRFYVMQAKTCHAVTPLPVVRTVLK